MASRRVFLLCVPLILASCVAEPAHPGKSIGIEHFPGVKDLYAFAETQRAKHDFPALGVGVIHNGKIVGLGMAGRRNSTATNWAALNDLFDVGSCAKSMTATVAAMLVEEGALRWDTPVMDVFPEWRKTTLPAYAHITFEQLLNHRSGLDQWMKSNPLWKEWHGKRLDQSATKQRLEFAVAALQRNPKYPPGEGSFYCNDGYLVAGSVMEKVSGQSFEELVRRRLFEPLQLTNAMFGGKRALDRSGIAWGHEPRSFGRTRAVKPDATEYGDPPFGSPGGFLYCSMPDLLRFVDFHIRGANGKGTLLKPESFRKLHTPTNGHWYGIGWNVELTSDAKGRVIERSVSHGGYTGRSRANMWFCPESNWGTVIVCNDGRGDGAEMSGVFFALLREFELVR